MPNIARTSLLLLLATTGALHAAPDPVVLPTLVVTPGRALQDVSELPYRVQALSATNLLERQVRSLPEALSQVPGASVQKTAQGQGSPYLRGFTGFRTLLLVDGIRLNNSVFREGPNQYWNTVDHLGVERLEVVQGPGSVLYGSDAIGGTVNALTLSPRREQVGFGGRIYGRHATADDSLVGRADVDTRASDRLSLRAGMSWKTFDDLRAGDGTGRQPKTGYDEWAADAKAVYELDQTTRLTLAHQHLEIDDAWRTHRTLYGESFAGTTVGSDQVLTYDQGRRLTYLRLDALDRAGAVRDLQATLSLHTQREDQYRLRKDGRADETGFAVDTYGVGLQAASETPLGELTYGADYYRDEVDAYGRNRSAAGVRSAGTPPVAHDASYDLAGVFLQDRLPLGDDLALTLGGRYTYARAEADDVFQTLDDSTFALSEDWNAFVASARLLYRPDGDAPWQAFAGASQGFRAPNLSDLTRFDIARSGEIETPTQDLDPEEFVSWEAGLRAEGRRAGGSVTLFRTDIQDQIVRTPTGREIDGDREVTKRNGAEGYVQGAELAAFFHPAADWTAHAQYAWIEGELDAYPTADTAAVREPMDKLMPSRAQAGLRWDHPARRVWLEGLLVWADRQDKLSTADRLDTQRIPPGGTPGYTVWTARGGWRPTDDLALTAAVENLTDEDYRVHGSGVNEAGRQLVVSGEFRF